MKNKKRLGMVAILLVVGVVALTAAPAFAQRGYAPAAQVAQPVQQRIMAQDCLDEDYFASLPADVQAEIKARWAAAEERQALAQGGQFMGRQYSQSGYGSYGPGSRYSQGGRGSMMGGRSPMGGYGARW